jgi:hypothetical protein
MAVLTVSELQAMEAELIRKIAAGERSVSFQTHSVTYRDMDEMKEALAFVRTEIQRLGGAVATKQQIRMVTRDGYGEVAR